MRWAARTLLLFLVISPWELTAQQATHQQITRDYYFFVCAESEDQVALLRFGPAGLSVVKNISVGSFPADIEGPHGINLSPDGKHLFVSISHGRPYGSIHKYATETGEWLGSAGVGMFPATMAVSPGTGLLCVVNFNLYGKMEPSSISVVETRSMEEVAQVPTGIMPHGGRFDRKGQFFYSVNMMEDQLVEMDAHRFEISRVLVLHAAGKHKKTKKAMGMAHGTMGHKTSAGGQKMAMDHDAMLQPTWVTAPSEDGVVYVAGNNKAVILEVDLKAWRVTRKLGPTGKGPYNLALASDGRTLVATYKKDRSVGFWDLEKSEELARPDTLRRIPHGVIITPDDRFALVTVEGVGGEPGMVEVFDMASHQRVASVDMGKQAGGIAFWKMGQ